MTFVSRNSPLTCDVSIASSSHMMRLTPGGTTRESVRGAWLIAIGACEHLSRKSA